MRHQRAGELHARLGPVENRGASRAGGGLNRDSLRSEERKEIRVGARFRRISNNALAHEPLVLRRLVEADVVVELDQRPHHPERGVGAGELESAAHVEGRGFQMLLACGLGVRGAAHHHDACDGFMRQAELEMSLTEIGMLGHPLFV